MSEDEDVGHIEDGQAQGPNFDIRIPPKMVSIQIGVYEFTPNDPNDVRSLVLA